MIHLAFVWFVRFAVLIVASVTLNHMVSQLGYRVNLQVIFTAALLTIVTVRLWMPWSLPPRDDR